MSVIATYQYLFVVDNIDEAAEFLAHLLVMCAFFVTHFLKQLDAGGVFAGN